MRRMLLCVTLAVLAASAGAIMVPQTTADLVGHATLVVTGTVESVNYTPPDGRMIISTEARVRIDETVVGASAEDVVTVRALGGRYGDTALVVEDQPVFEEGEEVVLFLAPDAKGGYHCPDATQGKKTIISGTVLPDGVTLDSFLAAVAAAAH
jgi:hypothetical protein